MNNENKQEEEETLQKVGQTATRVGLNVATGGTYERIRKAPVIGGLAKKTEQKIGKKLTSNSLSKKLGVPTNLRKKVGAANALTNASSKTGGNPINENLKTNATPKSEDVGETNLKKSAASRKSNLFNFRRKKNKKGNNGKSESSQSTSASNNEKSDDSVEKEKEKLAKKVKRAIIRKLLIIAAPIFLILFLILGIVMVIGTLFPFLLPELNDEEKNLISEVGSENYDKEMQYYDKLNEVSKKYQEQCGKEFDISVIHTSLMYLYYQTDYDSADYDKMSEMVDTVTGQISDACNVDYSIGGEFYNNLKKNEDFINYYQVLIDDGETIDNILNEIFEISEDLNINDDVSEETFVSEETIVNVNQSGKKVNINYGTIPNKTQNVQTNSNDPITFKDYLAGSVYASIDTNDLSNKSKIQSLAIVNTTNLLNGNSLSSGSQVLSINGTNNNYCSVKDGCSYNKNGDLVSGPGKKENNNNVSYGGKYYYKIPLTNAQINNLDSNVDSVYGNVLTGSTTTLDISKVLRIEGQDYKEMLNKAYPGYTINNISENNYAKDLNYGARKVQTNVIFYDQKDYSNQMFCHRTGSLKNNSIGYAGCGVTAMAIVASTYKNSKIYDPVYMSERSYKTHTCGSDNGTYTGFYCKEAKALGYKCSQVGKKTSEKQFVLNHLSKGHLVIIHVGEGSFTGSGHYMVLSGIDPETKKVYVTDPNNRSNIKNRKTGSGWYSFNSIVKQVKHGFFVIWKG